MPDDNAQAVENKETAPVSGTPEQSTPPAAAAPAAPSTPAAPASAPGAATPPAEAKPGEPAAPADGTKPAAGDPPKVAEKPGETTYDQAKVVEDLISKLPADQQEAARTYAKTRPLMEVFRGALAAQSKITELSEAAKGRVKVPGKDAKPDEIAAFEKAIGVPETADKYEIKRPDGVEVTELDKVFDGKAKEAFKAARLNQEQVDALVKLDNERSELATQEAARRITAAAEQAQNDLRVHFGTDYAPRVEMMNRYVAEMAKTYGPEFAETFNERFGSGIAVGERPGFVKWFDEHVVSKWADDNGLPRGIAQGGGISDETRRVEIQRMAHGTPAEQADYASDRVQNELKGIIARQLRQGKIKAA